MPKGHWREQSSIEVYPNLAKRAIKKVNLHVSKKIEIWNVLKLKLYSQRLVFVQRYMEIFTITPNFFIEFFSDEYVFHLTVISDMQSPIFRA